jgi:hypothetical protein
MEEETRIGVAITRQAFLCNMLELLNRGVQVPVSDAVWEGYLRALVHDNNLRLTLGKEMGRPIKLTSPPSACDAHGHHLLGYMDALKGFNEVLSPMTPENYETYENAPRADALEELTEDILMAASKHCDIAEYKENLVRQLFDETQEHNMTLGKQSAQTVYNRVAQLIAASLYPPAISTRYKQ